VGYAELIGTSLLPQIQVVAIVDDEPSVREALADLLDVEGYSTRLYASGAAILADPDLSEIVCVITDVRMPGVNGLELQRQLRQQDSGLPIIFVTSSADEGLRARAFAEGAADWFIKPVADGDLLASLASALDGLSPTTEPRP
jgi:two-component system response regulator FixJ